MPWGGESEEEAIGLLGVGRELEGVKKKRGEYKGTGEECKGYHGE